MNKRLKYECQSSNAKVVGLLVLVLFLNGQNLSFYRNRKVLHAILTCKRLRDLPDRKTCGGLYMSHWVLCCWIWVGVGIRRATCSGACRAYSFEKSSFELFLVCKADKSTGCGTKAYWDYWCAYRSCSYPIGWML